jgi:hypothetical protein
LYHFEIGNGDAARIAEEIGYDVAAVLMQDGVGLGGGRAIGQFGDQFGVYAWSILFCDFAVQGRRRQHGYIQFENFPVADRFGARGTDDRTGFLFMIHHFFVIQSVGLVDAAPGIAHGDGLQSQDLSAQFVGEGAGVAVSLDRLGRSLKSDSQYVLGFA